MVFSIRSILSYIRIPSGGTARKRGWNVSPMWPVPPRFGMPGVGDGFAGYGHRPRDRDDGSVNSPDAGVASTSSAGSDGHLYIEPGWEKSRPGLVPFVSCGPGAYGRLMLTVYVRWRTGLLVSSDWLRPVTRAAGGPVFRTAGAVRLTSAD